jgi:hypothetical protein
MIYLSHAHMQLSQQVFSNLCENVSPTFGQPSEAFRAALGKRLFNNPGLTSEPGFDEDETVVVPRICIV